MLNKIKNDVKGEYTLIVPSLEPVGPVNFAADIGASARKSGWKVRILYLSNSLRQVDLGFAFEVRKFRISDIWLLCGVVHTHCLRPDLLGIFLGWNKKIKLITTVHNFFLIDLGYLINNQFLIKAAWYLWIFSLKFFDHVVCISEAMRQYYYKNIPDQKFDLIYIFRSKVMVFSPPSDILAWVKGRKCEGDIVLSFVGIWSERKNVLGLIDALSFTKSISIIFCGDGPLRESVHDKVISNELQGRVFLAGRVDCPVSIIQQSDALVLPSFAEGFPAVVIEAASVGVPSLLSDIDVHREIASVGFGCTFNHLNFSDFLEKAQMLCHSIPAPSLELTSLWSKKFTPVAGFAYYESLFNSE